MDRLVSKTSLLVLVLFVAAGNAEKDLYVAYDGRTYVDLTYDFKEGVTLTWPTHTPYRIVKNNTAAPGSPVFWQAKDFCTTEHMGTHMDAPSHFDKNGRTLDQIPFDHLIAPLAVIDISEKAKKNADYQLSVSDLEDYEKKHGAIPKGAFVFMNSGWGKRWPDRGTYQGDKNGDTTKFHFPAFSPQAAQWMVDSGRVRAIGVDTASFDYGQSKDFQTHIILLKANIFGFENVANMHLLPAKGAQVFAMPMKLWGGTGAPTRLFAAIGSGVKVAHNVMFLVVFGILASVLM